MATQVKAGGHSTGFRATARTDNWWAKPMATFIVLMIFIVYVTVVMLMGNHYYTAPYLSPLFEPLLFVNPNATGAAPVSHAWFGAFPDWWPKFLASPAILILVFPAAFRLTCYYYRKAYYRAFAASPPGCAVGGIRQGKYKGETRLMLFQNLHRYALYFALLYPPLLFYSAFQSLSKGGQIGFGVGSIVLFVNAVLLTGFTLGCNSFRHLVGGNLDCYTCPKGRTKMRYGTWRFATFFNKRHAEWAWVSLIFVMVTDLYVRLVSMGVITDLNTWS